MHPRLNDQTDLYHFGRGHTNGDSFVVFPAARVMHTGDMFQLRGDASPADHQLEHIHAALVEELIRRLDQP